MEVEEVDVDIACDSDDCRDNVGDALRALLRTVDDGGDFLIRAGVGGGGGSGLGLAGRV